jgi:hypothetical protein
MHQEYRIRTGDVISPKLLYKVKALAVYREETRIRESRKHPIQPSDVNFIRKAVDAPDVNMFLDVI